MDTTSSEQPMTVTATAHAPPPLLALQRIKDYVVQFATEFGAIRSPETRCREMKARIDLLFKQLREQQSGDEKSIRDEIVRYAGELKMFEVSGVGGAAKEYEDEISSLLQRLSDRLVETIGLAIIERSLQNVAAGNLEPNLPDGLLKSNEKTATRPQPVQLRGSGLDPTPEVIYSPRSRGASVDASAKVRPRTDVSGRGDDIERLTTREIEQRLTKEHQRDEEQERPDQRNAEPHATTGPPQDDHGKLDSRQGGNAVAMAASAASKTAASPCAVHSKVDNDQNGTENTVAIQVIDADGCLLGVLKHAGRWGNNHADTISQRNIKRPVRIRQGRAFDQAQLDAISDQSDTEGVKLIPFMIQATGNAVEQPCRYCEKKQGSFEDCIMLDDERFTRCGNCVRSRQRCEGSSVPSATRPNGVQTRRGTKRRLSHAAALNGPPPATTRPRNQIGRLSHSSRDISVPMQSSEVFQASSVAGAPAISLPQEQHETPEAENAHVHDYCFAEESSDAHSCSGTAMTQNGWRIHQIKTRHFASAKSPAQYWRWVEEEGCLKYMVLINTPPVQWRVLQEPIDFNVELKEVAEVRASAKAWRVQLIMLVDQSILGRDEAPRGDVMVVFEGETTTREFLRFCRNRNINVVEQEAPAMVDVWRNMASNTLLPDLE